MTSQPELWNTVRSVLARAQRERPLTRISTDAPAPLSPQQALYWDPDALDTKSRFTMPIAFPLGAPASSRPVRRLPGGACRQDAGGPAGKMPALLDPARLERALREVARRHEILRTCFIDTGDGPHAYVMPPDAIRLGDRRTAFALDEGPLCAFALDDDRFLATFHHAIFDGWSLGVFARELSAAYAGVSLPEPALQYADYARWTVDWLQSAEAERQRAYWRAALGELPEPNPPKLTPGGAIVEYKHPLPPVRARNGATPFATLAAAFALLLHRFTGNEAIGLGTTFAGRARRELVDAIGCFINAVPLPVFVKGEPFDALVGRVSDSARGAFANAEIPIDEEATWPLQVLFLLQNFPRAPLVLSDIQSVGEETPSVTDYGLMVVVDGTTILWQGHEEMFDRELLASLGGQYEELLRALADNSQPPEPNGDELKKTLVSLLRFV